jgi:hypothetical protein
LLAGVLGGLGGGCASDGDGRGADCDPHPGMTAEKLVSCGCIPARSGGGSVTVEGYGGGVSENIILVHYICPRGGGRLARASVVNGVVQRVMY